MSLDGKNIKDIATNSTYASSLQTSFILSYKKAGKLVTALYMVTDIIEKEEPLRLELRTLGTSLISDSQLSAKDILEKVASILSLLDIAKTLGVISEMNWGILEKEFLLLQNYIKERSSTSILRGYDLGEFLKEEELPQSRTLQLGIQKGNTLLRAIGQVSDRKSMSNKHGDRKGHDFDLLKKERRFEITRIIKLAKEGATITDIKAQARGVLLSCGEKTLQRELVSMVGEGVLKKTGEKRWSRYYLAASSI